MGRVLRVRSLWTALALLALTVLACLLVEALRPQAPLPVFSHCAPF